MKLADQGPKSTKPSETGRRISADEAEFLKNYLLQTEPIVVVGTEEGKKHRQVDRPA